MAWLILLLLWRLTFWLTTIIQKLLEVLHVRVRVAMEQECTLSAKGLRALHSRYWEK